MSSNKGMLKYLIALVLICSTTTSTRAQEEIFSLGFQLGTGARSLAMGGAYSSIGGDYSASLWNPAGLADIKRIEVFGSMSHLMRQNVAGLGIAGIDDVEHDASFTKLNDFGFAYPVPTIQGSLVFAFGFNRVKTFDSNFAFEWFNSTSDDSVNQAWREIHKGSLNVWNFSGAVDVSPNVSLGLGLNFWTGGNDTEFSFRDVDIDNIWFEDVITKEKNVDSKINGFNLKGGGLFRIGRLLRIGGTISTPVTFNVDETWSTFVDTLLDDGTLIQDPPDEGFLEYKIQSPWTFSAGASLNLLNLVVSGDIEYSDWSQVEFKSDPPDKQYSQTSANRLIRDHYRATTRYRLGAEFTLPLTGLSFRAGYFYDPSILQNRDRDEDKQFYSAGVGFLVDKQVKLDVAFVHGFWKRFNSGLEGTNDIGSYFEDIKTNRVFVTLAFRM
ncbi:MAG: OmpP1/FadL family transporter [bacterium]